MSKPVDRPTRYPGLVLACIYLGLVWMYGKLGMVPEENSLHWGFQLADAYWLQQDALGTLLFDHTQPPLYNAMHGFLIQLAPNTYALLGISIQLVMLWASAWMMWHSLNLIHAPHWLLWGAPLVWLGAPGLHLFHWMYFYEALSLFLIHTMVLGAVRYFQLGERVSLFLSLGCIVLLSLSRTWAHPLLPLVAGLVLIRSIPLTTTQIRIILFTIAFAWLPVLKNGIVFGVWSSSSWGGMNLARAVLSFEPDTTSPAYRNELQRIRPFQEWSHYAPYFTIEKSTQALHPSLDQPYRSTGYANFRYLGYLDVSRSYRSTALSVLFTMPQTYIQHVGFGLVKFFYPIHAVDYFEMNPTALHYPLIWACACCGQWNAIRVLFHYPPLDHPIAKVCVLWMVAAVVLLIRAVQLWRQKRATPLLVLGLIWCGYIVMVSSFLEYGENMRFRMMVMPVLPVLLVSAHIFNRKATPTTVDERQQSNRLLRKG